MQWLKHAVEVAIPGLVVAIVVALPTPASAVAVQAVNDDYTVGANATFLTPDGHGIFANHSGISSTTRFKLIRGVTHGGLGPDYTPDYASVGVDSFAYDVTAPSTCLSAEAIVSITVEPIVERIGGADRYQVSAGVVAAKFSASHAGTVYVASGEKFPDALSVSAAAGATGDPVLLTSRDSLPNPTRDQMTRLHSTRIVVLGGTNTIGAAVETALSAYAPNVVCLDGADRYVVSAAVSASTFSPNRPVVYVASGEVFPDALSGSAAAGRLQAPILLVGKNEVPDSVAVELARLAPQQIFVLGGNNTVSITALSTLRKIAPTRRIDGVDRFALSANVSFDAFDSAQTHTVYEASREVFPDALSGSVPAILASGPILLVTRSGIPTAVDAELDQVRPARIVPVVVVVS